jgi:5-methylcytosine-specific restriction endonuclease McrA
VEQKWTDFVSFGSSKKSKTVVPSSKMASGGGGSAATPPDGGNDGKLKQKKKDPVRVNVKLSEEESKRFGVQRAIETKEKIAKEGRARLNQSQRNRTTTEIFRKNAKKQLERQGVNPKVLKKLDVDHVHELQLGGSDVSDNLQFLDRSVNRSIGAQISQQTRNLPKNTKIDEIIFSIVGKK